VSLIVDFVLPICCTLHCLCSLLPRARATRLHPVCRFILPIRVTAANCTQLLILLLAVRSSLCAGPLTLQPDESVFFEIEMVTSNDPIARNA
jgi:hypothetical protein